MFNCKVDLIPLLCSTRLHGKTLRIEDNPYVGVERARAEIYAKGLRNPWRIDNDPGDRDTGIETHVYICALVNSGTSTHACMHAHTL